MRTWSSSARESSASSRPSAGRSSWQVAEPCFDQLQPLDRVSHRRVGAYGGEGGRMIAAISIGIIIIVAVIIAALAIIYFILKGSPR
jgi:hypothetical protein